MSRTRVKICGITTPGDAQAAVLAGADALGLVFYAESKRAVSIEQAADIVREIPCFVGVVGLFVDAQADFVTQACNALPLSVLQFHGDESQQFCSQFSLPWMKALRVKPATDVRQAMQEYSRANAILLDTWCADSPGGTGESFDWKQVPGDSQRPLVLAGGLTASNVEIAIASTQPFAVDVSGGVESNPGVKDVKKIRAFMRAVARADQMNEMIDE